MEVNLADYLLDGLIEYLELERELGVRSVECDLSLLHEASSPPPVAVSPRPPSPASVAKPAPSAPTAPSASSASTSARFAFLHDRPLSPKAVEMMAKIVSALGETAETAPVVIEKPVPRVPLYVVLGGRALAKFLPGKKAGPGDWIKSDGGRDVLVTYSPEYILRFDGVSDTTKQIKQSMWRSLKAVKQRLVGLKQVEK